MSKRILTLGLSALALCTAAGAAAVAQPRLKTEPAVDRVQERRVYVRRDGHRDMSEHLRAVLQLRPDQEPALQAYLTAAKPGERHVERIETRGDDRQTTIERLAGMEERLNRQQAQTRAFIDATRRFYAQLDPAQKRAFDELPMLMVDVNVGPMLLPIAHVPPIPALPPMPDMSGFRHFEHWDDDDAPAPPAPPAPPMPPKPPNPPV